MAGYTISGHYLVFEAEYDHLVVKTTTHETAGTYYLTTENQSISVTVDDSTYLIGTAEDFETPTHTWDMNGGDTLSFSGDKLGGIIFVDVRDINRLSLDEGQYVIDYDLTCTTFRLKNVSGAFGFTMCFEGEGCFSTEEVED